MCLPRWFRNYQFDGYLVINRSYLHKWFKFRYLHLWQVSPSVWADFCMVLFSIWTILLNGTFPIWTSLVVFPHYYSHPHFPAPDHVKYFLMFVWGQTRESDHDSTHQRVIRAMDRFMVSAEKGGKSRSRFVWVASEDKNIPPGSGCRPSRQIEDDSKGSRGGRLKMWYLRASGTKEYASVGCSALHSISRRTVLLELMN